MYYVCLCDSGSYKLEEEFDDLPEEEAKKRLSLLVKKMDTDNDLFISKEELTAWIVMSFRYDYLADVLLQNVIY